MSPNFWWVNHSSTVQHEIEGSYLWFAERPHKSKARSESEKNIQRLLPADVVFSFADGALGAVGIVLGVAREAPKPAEFQSIAEFSDVQTGWHVPIRFMSLDKPLRTEEHNAELVLVLPRKHSPILSNGASNQHMQLASVPQVMSETLIRLLDGEVERVVETIVESVGRSLAEDATEVSIQQRTDIGPAQKSDLLKSRQGHGRFRKNLEQLEHSCRITGTLDRRHLWARHIKPWSDCDDAEKLDGSNGLLLAPHIAHLFERGYVSFSDEGELLVSQELNPVVLENWHIQLPLHVGEFAPEQCYFLDYHRREVFQQHGGGRRQKALAHFEAVPVVMTTEPSVVQAITMEEEEAGGEHEFVEYGSADHDSADHDSTDHDSTDQEGADHDSTDHDGADQEGAEDHRQIDHDASGAYDDLTSHEGPDAGKDGSATHVVERAPDTRS